MLEYKEPKIWTDAEIIYEMKFWREIEERDYYLLKNKNNKLNKFTQNKAISKIHDSFRVSAKEKELALAITQMLGIRPTQV